VLRVEPERRRLALSLKNVPLLDEYGQAIPEEPEPDWSRGYSTGHSDRPTIGDALGNWKHMADAEDDDEEDGGGRRRRR
jgi:hypothetical protein